MERKRPDPLRALNEALIAQGIDPTLPWLPEVRQLDLLIPLAIPVSPKGETVRRQGDK